MSYIKFLLVSLFAMAVYYAVIIFLDTKGKRKKESDFQDVTITGYSFDEEMHQYGTDNYFDNSTTETDTELPNIDDRTNIEDVPLTDDAYTFDERDVQENISNTVSQYDELVSSFHQSRIQFGVDSLKLTRDLFL
ncbi:MAG: hypothetical protein Q4G63_04420 [Bacteroidia bacterium]|nr:hypothetical protein [Bacteroidia bacterium]